MTDFTRFGDMIIERESAPLFRSAGLASFDDFMNFEGGRRICHKRGRSVFRFEIGDRAFYIKRNRFHSVEFWKGLSRFRLPPRGAWIEWQNILAVHAAGIPTVMPVAFGERRILGIETASFTVTEELYGAEPLDEILTRRLESMTREDKRILIKDLAALARKFHGEGMNHQDFYLNHFFVDNRGKFYLLDLQRVQRRKILPRHYLVKDLGQLAYSSLRFPRLSRTDKLRFLLSYQDKTGLDVELRRLIEEVSTKCQRISRHDKKLRIRRQNRGELPPCDES